jgi:small-conductance mechanosensitive channel
MELFATLIFTRFLMKQAPSTKVSPHIGLFCIVLLTVVLQSQSQSPQESHQNIFFLLSAAKVNNQQVLHSHHLYLITTHFLFHRKIVFLAIVWTTYICREKIMEK